MGFKLVRHNEAAPLKPLVKVFYSVEGSHYLAPEDIDLAISNTKLAVESAVLASDYKIDFNTFFDEKIAL